MGAQANIRNLSKVGANMHIALTVWNIQSACSLTSALLFGLWPVGLFPAMIQFGSKISVWSKYSHSSKPSCYVDSSTIAMDL